MIMRKLGIEKDSIMMVFLVGVLLVTVITKGYFYGAVASILSVLILIIYLQYQYILLRYIVQVT